jgi:glutathione synthase/RimK-type ligase-like ATP-grasp enzyme
MKIGIHHREGSYSPGWIRYCEQKGIEYKVVNCYDNDIIEQLADCDALMWHHSHEGARDVQMARQLLYALEGAGKVVYPDFSSGWHFDDKVAQKYLLESIHAPFVPTHVFYTRKDALEWAHRTSYPKVFKLRGGSSSDHVKLVRTKRKAIHLIHKAFGRGFKRYRPIGSLNERWRLFRIGRTSFMDVLKGWIRLIRPTHFSRMLGRDRGYAYFQDFIPGNTHDIRINYVNNRCFAARRGVRPGDFRASGSFILDYDQSRIPREALKTAFEVAHKLKLQTAAIDFVLKDGKPLIVELCYAFGTSDDLYDHGYYDRDLNHHQEAYNVFGWMVDDIVEKIRRKQDLNADA